MDQKRNFASRRKSRDIPLAKQRKSLDYSGPLECNFYQFHLYNFRLFKALCLKTPPYAQY